MGGLAKYRQVNCVGQLGENPRVCPLKGSHLGLPLPTEYVCLYLEFNRVLIHADSIWLQDLEGPPQRAILPLTATV